MLKWIVVAGAAAGLITPAQAEISQDLKFCAGLKNSTERLACYDAAARIEKRDNRELVTRPITRTPASNAMAYSPAQAPAPKKSRFEGAYVGFTAGYDIPATALRDPPYPYYYSDPPADAIGGVKVGLVGGYNVTIDRLLLGIEGRWQHNYSVATATGGSSWGAQTIPFVTYNPSLPFTILESNINTTRLSHPDQLDFSVRAGVLFGDLMLFGKVGAGIESTRLSYTNDRRQSVQCVSPIIQLLTVSGYTYSQVIGCSATVNGTITRTSVNSINPIAVFGGGIEYDFGNVFARVEAEMIAHLVSGSGTSSYTPAANFTVGYRF